VYQVYRVSYRIVRVSYRIVRVSYRIVRESYRIVRVSYPIVRISYRIVYHVKNNVAGTVPNLKLPMTLPNFCDYVPFEENLAL
jgi:hypothetical protein